MQKTDIETCQKKNKKQERNMEETDIETWQKIKKQAKRVTKKTIIQQKVKCIFCII